MHQFMITGYWPYWLLCTWPMPIGAVGEGQCLVFTKTAPPKKKRELWETRELNPLAS